MWERVRPLLQSLATFVAPGLVLLLLGIQVAFGLRGFDRPDGGLLQVLQVPGVLLGWGGVVLLLPLLIWMILDWWGYDLNGFALKGLGSAVLGIAAGTLFGLVGEGPGGNVAMGGLVGGNLAGLLAETVGETLAFAILALMAAPAAVLALSLQKAAARPTRETVAPRQPRGGLLRRLVPGFTKTRHESPTAKQAEADSWYPERRFDAEGNELPVRFPRERDVGAIRFVEPETDDAERDDVPAQDDAETEAPAAVAAGDVLEGEERLPTIPELLAGNYAGARRSLLADPSGGPREADDEPVDDAPIHVDSEGRPLAPGVRWTAPAEEEPAPVVAPREKVPVEMQRTLPFVPADPVRPPRDPELMPGVRYADSEPPAEPGPDEDDSAGAEAAAAATPEEAPMLSAQLADAVRGPVAHPEDAAHTARSIRETLRQKVEAIQADGASNRYLAKLEALGLFESTEPPAPPAKATGTAPPKKAAPRKPAAKKAAAKKTSARQPARAKPASGSAVARPAAAKTAKRPAAAKTAKRPAAAKATKPAAAPTATKKAPAKKKGAKRAARPKAAPGKAPGRKATAAKPRRAERAPPTKDGPQARAASGIEARRRAALLDSVRIERLDPLFSRAMEAALERGAASAVLLTRRLGLPFARAQALLDRMVACGALEADGLRGSYRVTLTPSEWASLTR